MQTKKGARVGGGKIRGSIEFLQQEMESVKNS
jgi:hypothetical protein